MKLKDFLILNTSLLIVGLIGTYIYNFIFDTNIKKIQEPIQEVYKSPYPDYDIIKTLITDNISLDKSNENGFYKIIIAENLSLKDNKKTFDTSNKCFLIKLPYIINKDKDTMENLMEENNLLRAYLYIKASVENGKQLDKITDDVYFTVQKIKPTENKDHGGHLKVDENLLPTPIFDNSVFFYNMNSISFERNRKITKNFSFIDDQIIKNNNNQIKVRVGIRSESKNMKLHNAYILYKCSDNSQCITKTEC